MEKKVMIGVPGRKYGLQQPASATAKPAKPVQKLSIFQLDDDEAPNEQVARSQIDQGRQKKLERERQKAVEQDPTVFQYDEVHDKLQSDKHEMERSREAKAKDRTPKYIGENLKQTENRKREQSIIETRIALKEIAQDEEKFGSKDKFMTASYKEKLAQDKIFLKEMDKKDAADAAKSKNMAGFMSGLLDARIGRAEGEAVLPKDVPTYTAPRPPSPSRRRKHGPPVLSEKEFEELKLVKQQQEEEKEKKLQEQMEKLRRRNDDTSVLSAKERYLARKKGAATTSRPRVLPQVSAYITNETKPAEVDVQGALQGPEMPKLATTS